MTRPWSSLHSVINWFSFTRNSITTKLNNQFELVGYFTWLLWWRYTFNWVSCTSAAGGILLEFIEFSYKSTSKSWLQIFRFRSIQNEIESYRIGWIQVYDGPNAQSRLLLTHSGRLSVSQSLRSTRNFLYVEYPSYSHPNSAFFAFYAAVNSIQFKLTWNFHLIYFSFSFFFLQMDAAGDSRSPYIPGNYFYLLIIWIKLLFNYLLIILRLWWLHRW